MAILNKGDKIIIVSPSSCIEKNALDKAMNWFAYQGINVALAKHTFDVCSYMAGDDADRAEDINKAFADVSIKAIFCSRGGAGSTKILDFLDFDMIKKNPKPVFGLSDSTALQNALYEKAGIVSYTGFLPVYDFKENEIDRLTEQSLLNVFEGVEQCLSSGEAINLGVTEGVMIGGNLSVLCYLCGTKYFPNLENKILLLEDIGEKTYRIDLMLNQLKQQKNFNKIKGIIFGKFSNCVQASDEDDNVASVLKEFAKNLDIPIIYNFDYGHIKSRYVLPIGKKIVLDANKAIVKIPNL